MSNEHIKYTLPDGTKLPCLCDVEGWRDPIWLAFYNKNNEKAYCEFGMNYEPHRISVHKQTFPSPPEGKEWHNPECLTAEQVEVADGWRLTLKGESRDIPSFLLSHRGKWELGSGYSFDITYRTKAPLPKPLKVIQLTREEWRRVAWITDKDGNDLSVNKISEDYIETESEVFDFDSFLNDRRTGHDFAGNKMNLFREVEG